MHAFDLSRVSRAKASYCDRVTSLFRLGDSRRAAADGCALCTKAGCGYGRGLGAHRARIRIRPLVVRDFRAKGISHVRIRVADEPTEAWLIHLRKLVEACEQYGVIRLSRIRRTAIKTIKADNEKEVTDWWIAVAHYFGGNVRRCWAFDLIYEPADKLNHNAASLNGCMKNHQGQSGIDADRMIFIAPPACGPEDPPQPQAACAQPKLPAGGVALSFRGGR